MAAVGDEVFQVWLSEKLKSLSPDIDTHIFVTYIIAILDTDSQEEESEENITELLSGVVDPDTASSACRSIISQWLVNKDSRRVSQDTQDVADKLSMMFEKQALATVKEKKLSKEQADRKAAILAQYGQVSDGEQTDPEEWSADESASIGGASTGCTASIGGASTGGTAPVKTDTSHHLLLRNVNKEEVTRVEREKREKAKEEQEKKKEKDKQDRLAQKQKQQERKETEKKRTQKGEKRR